MRQQSPGAGSRRLAAALLLLTAAGCGTGTHTPIDPAVSRNTAVLLPDNPDTSGWTAWFDMFMPDASRYPPAKTDEAVETCLRDNRVMLIPPRQQFSGTQLSALESFLEKGGRLLEFGFDAAPPGHTNAPVYAFTSSVLRLVRSGETIHFQPRPMKGPFWSGNRMAGSGGREIPVAEALDQTGGLQGRPARISVIETASGHHAVCGWAALDADPDEPEKLVPFVEEILALMMQDMFLHPFGLSQHSARAGTPLTASAGWIDLRRRDLTPIRFAVEWVNERGVQIKRVISAPLDPLIMPAVLNIGLAPEISSRAETFTVRYLIRDRNDLATLDSFARPFKVFDDRAEISPEDYLTVSAGQLTHRRRPAFLLGVNYWPRLSSFLLGRGVHWLDHDQFDPTVLASDLDLMAAVGINAVALEYTRIDQAPQLRYVLDELQMRGIWACLYVPALYPLDLHMQEARRMLEALRLEEWPNVFALEVARGLAVRPRNEMRVLDRAWHEWLMEHFNSPLEAEQKLGISLWKERGHSAGPPDTAVLQGPRLDRGVAVYYAFLADYVSRRAGYIRRWLDARGYHPLLTMRSRYGEPDEHVARSLDYLDMSAAAMHQDFLFPDAWSTHPLRTMSPETSILAAYARGAGNGKPVLWSEFGENVGEAPADAAARQRQKEVYSYFIDAFLESGGYGAFAWWFPPGPAHRDSHEDWGIVEPHGEWRAVEEVFRTARYRQRQARIQARTAESRPAPVLIRSANEWRSHQSGRTGMFAFEDAADVTEWTLPGVHRTSSELFQSEYRGRWNDLDAFVMLNAEWTDLKVDDAAREREPGEEVPAYVNSRIEMEILNTGTVRWDKHASRVEGSVWLRISQPGKADVWLAPASLKRGERKSVLWVPRETGPWTVQPYLIGYGRFGEQLRIQVTTPPELY